MRLLNSQTLKLKDFQDDARPPYAILSHRWGSQEVTYQQLVALAPQGGWRPLHDLEGFQKITNFCRNVARQGLEWGWIDTCCIDKTSSAELNEAINSMFQWYKDARVCYVYLFDVQTPLANNVSSDAIFDQLSASQWFTRGWTLQELLAPKLVQFFAKDWGYLGDKSTLATSISVITGIDEQTLAGADLRRVSIARRMFWASQRSTTRKEDMAYCLLGVFGVNMPLLYGEGDRAFMRLQEEILRISDDQSIYAWEDQCKDDDELLIDTGDTLLRGPFAQSPAEFANSGDIVPYRQQQSSQPHATTNLGLRMELPLHRMRHSTGKAPLYLAELACHYQGDFTGSLGIYIRPLFADQFARDHGKRAPVVVDPNLHYPPVRSTVYLRKDARPLIAEDFDRHHGFFVHLLPPEHGFKISYVFPKEQWMKTKGNTAIILNPGSYATVVFRHRDERQISVLMSHESMANELYESYGLDTWERGKCRCKIFVNDSALGLYTDESLASMEGSLKYEGARAARFREDISGGCEKTVAEMQDGKFVIAEMKKETIMGERMIVVNVQIDPPLFQLSGISSVKNPPLAQSQQSAIPLQAGLPPPPPDNGISSPPQVQPGQQTFAPYGHTPAQPGQLQGFSINMPGGQQGFLLLQQSLQANPETISTVSYPSHNLIRFSNVWYNQNDPQPGSNQASQLFSSSVGTYRPAYSAL